jgi:hypothetical protein
VKFALRGRTGTRAIGIYAAIARVRLQYSQWKSVPEKLIGSLVVAYLPTTRDVYEPITYHLGVSEELSSTAACPRAKDICSTNFVRLRRSTTKTLMLVQRLQERDRFAAHFL